MFASPSRLPDNARRAITAELNASLTDGIDLASQLKVAHWNVKGPYFATLHPLFETFAVALATHNDDIAERAVTLGAFVPATARRAAAASRIPELPPETTRGLELVRALADRFEVYLDGLRAARGVADQHQDLDTSDLLTAVIEDFEKHGWFLRATLEG